MKSKTIENIFYVIIWAFGLLVVCCPTRVFGQGEANLPKVGKQIARISSPSSQMTKAAKDSLKSGLTERDFGALESQADSWSQLNDYIAYCRNNGINAIFSRGKTYKISKELNVSGVSVNFNDCTIVATHSTMSPSTHPNYAIVSAMDGSEQVVGTIAANVAIANQNYIKTALFSNFSANDLLSIRDPTPYSFSTISNYDQNGEYLEVLRISNDTIFFKTAILKTFVNTSNIVKCNYQQHQISNLNVVGTNIFALSSTECAVKIKNGKNVLLQNVNVLNTAYAGIDISFCFGGMLNNCAANKISADGGTGLSYGLSIASCYNLNVFGGFFYGSRHGIAQGSYSVINTNIRVFGASISSREHNSADLHAATRFSSYESCTITNGVNLSGYRNTVQNCNIFSNTERCLNLTGTSSTIINNSFFSSKDVTGYFINAQSKSSHMSNDSNSLIVSGNIFNFEGTSQPTNEGIYLDFASTSPTTSVDFTANTFVSNFRLRAAFRGQTFSLKRLFVSQNNFTKTVLYVRDVINLVVSNNQFSAVTSYPLECENYFSTNTTHVVKDNLFLNNTLPNVFWSNTGMNKLHLTSNYYMNNYDGSNNYSCNERIFNIDSVYTSLNMSKSTNQTEFYYNSNSYIVGRFNRRIDGEPIKVVNVSGGVYVSDDYTFLNSTVQVTSGTVLVGGETFVVNPSIIGVSVNDAVAVTVAGANLPNNVAITQTSTATNSVRFVLKNMGTSLESIAGLTFNILVTKKQ